MIQFQNSTWILFGPPPPILPSLDHFRWGLWSVLLFFTSFLFPFWLFQNQHRDVDIRRKKDKTFFYNQYNLWLLVPSVMAGIYVPVLWRSVLCYLETPLFHHLPTHPDFWSCAVTQLEKCILQLTTCALSHPFPSSTNQSFCHAQASWLTFRMLLNAHLLKETLTYLSCTNIGVQAINSCPYFLLLHCEMMF